MRKRFLGLALICILGLVVAGCAPRPGGGQTAAMAEDDDLVVDLPSIVIDVASDGSTSIGGFDLEDLTGQGVAFPAASVQDLTALNVQHIGIDMHPTGLTLRVNGLPFLGSVQYDSESLGNISSIMEDLAQGTALTALGDLAPIISVLTPVLDNLGIGVIVKFPVSAGAEPIPLLMDPMDSDTMDDVAGFLASVEQQPRISVPILLAEDGSWSVGELNQSLVEGLLDAQGTLGLPPETVALMSLGGIKELQVSTAENGLAISINGYGLPVFTWSNGEIESLMALQEAAPTLAGIGEVLGLVSNILPLLQITDVTITLVFPDMM